VNLWRRNFKPRSLSQPSRMLDVASAWKGNEQVIADILDRFAIRRERCLEFGVEYGYSTVVLSSYFDQVTGIDLFAGDIHSGYRADHYEETSARLAPFTNITLVKSDYRDWIYHDATRYDLIHVDIVHTYEDTFRCGLWSASHSSCTLFHDTESFPEVKQAVREIASQTGKKFYNYKPNFGLGIVV
jgi:hypothetical protein